MNIDTQRFIYVYGKNESEKEAFSKTGIYVKGQKSDSKQNSISEIIKGDQMEVVTQN